MQRDKKAIGQAMRLAYYPVVAIRAEGAHVWDLDGNEYIYFLGGAASLPLGHGHPEIIQIIQELVMLLNEILTLPIRVLISESHYGIKSAVKSVVSEEEGLYGSVRERMDNIFDQIQEIRK